MFCTARSSGKHWFFVSAINILFSFTAIVGNTLILIALHKQSSLHPPSKLLYRCLAVTDRLAGLIVGPSNALHNSLVASEQRLTDMCFYSAAISTVSFTILSAVSLLTITAISVDRLLALLLGLRYRHIVTLRRVLAFVFVFWITSITFASMSFWKYEIPKGFNCTLILVCIIVSAFCYSKIILKLGHNPIQVHHIQGQPNGGGISMDLERYRKTLSSAICVLVALVACYLPYSIIMAIVVLHGSSAIREIIWDFTVTLVLLNSSLNPILYCWKIRDVRVQVNNSIRQLLCWSN